MRLRILLLLASLTACGDDAEPAPADNVAPEAQLNASTEIAAIGEPVGFSAGGSLDADGTIVSYRFVFGDGSPAIEGAAAETEHRFAAQGLYQVQLTVTDDAGATATATDVVNVGQP